MFAELVLIKCLVANLVLFVWFVVARVVTGVQTAGGV
jgi:hypothetical protein